jgi:hypothetical protein
MRFFRYNNHLLWLVVILSVGLMAYFVTNVMNHGLTSHSPTVLSAVNQHHSKISKQVRFELPPPTSPPSPLSPPSPQYVFMDLAKQDYLKDPYVGRIVFKLYPEVCKLRTIMC